MTDETNRQISPQGSRREFLVGSSVLVSAATLPALAIARAPRRPNILFILADDLGFADLSCYGRRDYRTPAIDGLAEQGLKLTHSYANSPVCSPTRVALITGRYQYRLPVGLEEPLAPGKIGLPPSHPTLPGLLKKVGYATGLIGKWHLGYLPEFGPLQSGYDDFWGFRGGALDYFNHTSMGKPDLWDQDNQTKQPGYLTDLIADRAIASIKRYAKRDVPFFLSLHFNAPHWPWEGPNDQAEAKRLAAKASVAADLDLDGGSQKTYAAIMTRLDHQVGRILHSVKSLGLYDDTIVVFTSDNGGERFSDTWPFTGQKTELLEGGIRVPALVRWPARIAAGTTSAQVSATMDWLPTLLEAAGVAPDSRFRPDGVSLLSTFDGKPPFPRSLFWRYMNLSQEACRSGDWKYLKILDNTFLFNVVEDPLERANLKDRYPQKYKELVQLYQSWNGNMLPLNPESRTNRFTGADIADRFGVKERRNVEIDSPFRPR